MNNFLRLLEAMERKRPVGTLVLGRRGKSCDLFVEEDRIYYASREFSGRVDIEGLLRAELVGSRVSPAVLETALSGANLVENPLPAVLLERGVINAAERASLMQSHLQEEIFGHVYKSGDSFSFQESNVPEHLLGCDPGVAVLPLQSVIELWRKREETLAVVDALLPSRKEVLVVTEKGMAHRNSPQGDFAVRRIFDLIDGFRTLNEIIRDVVFFEFQVLARLSAALVQGHLKKTVLPEVRDVVIQKLDRGEAARILPAFKAAVKHAVDEMGARERLALLHEHTGNREEAVIQYNFIGDALYRMKKGSKALKAYQRALDLHPGDPLVTDKVIKILQEAAEEALRDGKRDAALGLLRSALKIRPDTHALYERLLLLHIEAGEMHEAAAVCDAAAARSRTDRDASLGLSILKLAQERFPEHSLFRKKLVNLHLDFGMSTEAVIELEELARREMEIGQTARANEILEKVLRIDPDRDDIRRHLRGTGRRRRARRRILHVKLPLLKLGLIIALVASGYQYWSYVELQPFLETARASAGGQEPRSTGIVRGPREEQLLSLARGCERFQKRFPVSLFVFEAHRLAKQYRDEAARMGRDRDRRKEEIFEEAQAHLEKGRKDQAARAFQRLQALPANDPYRARAEKGLARIDSYQRAADELRQRAEAAEAAGDQRSVYSTVRRLLEEYPLSRAALSVEVPVRLSTIPQGAVLKVGGAVLGPSPQVVRVRPGKACEVEASAEGFLPLAAQVSDDGGPERHLVLSRRPLWTASLGGPLRYPPVIGKKVVLSVLASGALIARDQEDGAERWKHASGGVVAPVGPPVGAEGRYYLPLNDGEILGFSPGGGVEARIKPQALIATPLLVAGSHLVFGTTSGLLSGWDLRSNLAAWSVPMRGAPIRLAGAGDPQEILVGLEAGKLLRMEHPSGRVIWETAVGDELIAGPFEAGKAVVVKTADLRMVAVDARTGAVISRRALSPPFLAAVLPGTGRLLVVEEAGEGGSVLLEIDPATSRETARSALPSGLAGLFGSEGAAGATLAGGEFLYLEKGTYAPRWGYLPKRGRVTSLSTGHGLLVLATDAGELIAFQD